MRSAISTTARGWRARPGCAAALLKHKDAFVLSFTEHLMTYALGRRVEPSDMPAVRQVIRQAAAHDYRISSFVQGVVASAPFQMSIVRDVETATTTVQPPQR